ncbi:EsaB/YukD family protein [Streptomyces sp. TRM70308]|uniref:EsaB/YukD family protein n=1 Tax=Streptomyces sp. TRM70308 TaxID=3131932 RepID=UPI003CFDC20D
MDSVADQRTGRRRVTLMAEGRRVELALPAGRPVGELLPGVLRRLGDPPADRWAPPRLATPGGAALPPDATLASAGVADGTELRLLPHRAAPGAATGDTGAPGALGGRRGERARHRTAGAVHLVLGLTTAWCATRWFGPDAAGPWLLVAAALAGGSGVLAARAGARPGAARGLPELGTALLLLGGALGAYGGWAVADGAPARLAAVGLAVALALALLGWCTRLGRGGPVGAAAVVAAVGAWELALALTDAAGAGLALGVLSTLALGYLPLLALTGAGLTRLDDERSTGISVSRHQVEAALAATHRGLAPATVALALSAAAGGWLALGAPGGPTPWTATATALLALVLLTRARAYPLAVEAVALLAAGTLLAVRLLAAWAEHAAAYPLAVLAALALLPLGALVGRPPEPVRHRLRRIMDLAESAGTVLLIPVAIGAYGVYGRLLDTF